MSEQVLDLTAENFDETVKSGVTLVDFWAPWCGPCQMQTPILEKQVAPAMSGRAKICKVNVDEAQDLAARYGVRGIPAIFLFKDGEVVQQFTGLQRGDALVSALEDALGV